MTKTEQSLKHLNISALNEMQSATASAIKKGHEVLVLAPTGSGKTLAFLLPIAELIDERINVVQVLVLSPSRELSLQIEDVFKSMKTGFKVNCCYGGHPVEIEKNNLKFPPAILIGTPGRIADHIKRERIDTSTIRYLILDEFDKCLEFGFQEEMSFIIGRLNHLQKRILTSATAAIEIPEFTGITTPFEVNFLSESSAIKLEIHAIQSEGIDKSNTLFRLLCKIGNRPTLVFCNHRDAVERVSDYLFERGIESAIFHGGLEQDVRERSLIRFRNGSYRLLITTDLASRGLDISDVECIIHYQIPSTEEAYTHRNGRTARMKAEGSAYLIFADDDHKPEYLDEMPPFETLPEKALLPAKSEWETIYIGAGKKDKINKVDIVGFFIQKGNIQKVDIGLISVLDFASYVAVKRNKVTILLDAIAGEPIKKMRARIEVAL